jgi:ferrochelatase
MLDVPYDAILIVGFGGPEAREDVVPFLQNVLRGKPVPHERLLEVAEHYYHFGGASPINAQTRTLIDALRDELSSAGIDLPVYWGNRNWHPLLPNTVREMANDGVRRALAWVMSAYSSYSGCRQYLENIESARVAVGSDAPDIDKMRVFYNHPGFIEATTERIGQALAEIPAERISETPILYTAHSIPLAMAQSCAYERQLQETIQLASGRLGHERYWLAYQSRSGPPSQTWLEPDVCDVIESLSEDNPPDDVVIAPIGFLSDHLEVLYDLDVEAKQVCDELGINMVRAATVGTHPRFVRMIRELIVERITPNSDRPAWGNLGPSPDVCPPDCCRYVPRSNSPRKTK